MKKAALGLTLALAISATAACAPGGDQGAIEDQRFRGAGQFQERAHYNDNRTIGATDIRDPRWAADRRYRGLSGPLGFEDRGTDFRGRMFGGPRGGGFLRGGMGNRMFDAQDPDTLNRGNLRLGTYDAQRARDLEQKVQAVPGVENARVIVYGNDVICGVETADRNRDVYNRVQQELQEETRGQQVHVTDDTDLFGRIGDMDGRLQRGPVEAAGQEMQRLLDDIGRAITPGRQ